MGNDAKDSEAFNDFCPLPEKGDKITAFDFVDYQRTKDDSIRNKIAGYYREFSNKISSWFYYKTHRRIKTKLFKYFIDFEKEDFEQYGFLGLFDAIDKYNPFNSPNADFKNYAPYRIIGRIADELKKPLFFSGPLKRNGNKIPFMYSLDTGVGEPENGRYELKNSKNLQDKKTIDPLEQIILEDSILALKNGFPKRDYQIFIDYELKGYNLKEAGERAGISEGRACQIHSAIIKKARQEIKEKNLDFLNYIN